MGTPPRPGGGVEHRPDLDAAEPEPRRGTDDARSHRHDRGVGVRDVLRHRERAVHRHRLVVAAERVPARDRRVEEIDGRAAAPRGRKARAAARRRRSSRTRGGRSGARCLNATATAGTWLCSAAATTGMPSIDVTSASSVQCSSVLPTSVCKLVYRAFMMWPGPGSDHGLAREVPVHDVPTAGPEPELDRGRVHDDAVADVDPSGQLRQHVRRARARRRAVTSTRCSPTRSSSSVTTSPTRNDGTCRYRDRDQPLDAFVAGLERVLAEHGALRLVVELQVHPVDGVVALAFLGPLDERAAQPGARGLRRVPTSRC